MQKIQKRPHASSCGQSIAELFLRQIPLAALALTFAGLADAAGAAETPSFSALLARAQGAAPQLLGQAAEGRAARADATQARVWTNPTFDATVENLSAPLAGGVSQRQDTYTLTQVFELGGKRNARIHAADSKTVAAEARAWQAQVAFASELAVFYARAEAAQQRRVIAEAELTRARDDQRASQALVNAGREAQLRLVQASASVASAEAALESASADAAQALERLSAHVGAAEAFTQIDHPLLAMVSPPAMSKSTPDPSPVVAIARAERDAANAMVDVEQKRWYPDVGVTVGVRKFAWSPDKATTVGLSASIPLFDRNRSGVDAARARAESAGYRLEAARLEAAASHRAARAQVAASAKRMAAADKAEAAAAEAYRLGRIGYDAGKASLLELLSIRRALADAQARAIDARLARVEALATLSMAEGQIVFGEAQ